MSDNINNNNNNNNTKIIEQERAKAQFLFVEDIAPGARIQLQLHKTLHTSTSKFQQIHVIETYYGKTLVTDGKTQSAQVDEFAYHESLVHPAMFASYGQLEENPSGLPRTVFIGGGGELATAREVLKHKSVERVIMVDLDEDIIEVCKEHLPEWGGTTVTSDPRFTLIIGDAHAWIHQTSETFDVMIMDISDPIEAGPGIQLYTQEFYQYAATKLNPGGVFVTQAGSADSIPITTTSHSYGITNGGKEEEYSTTCFGPIRNTLQTAFDCVIPFSSDIPSFGADWGFCLAYNNNTTTTKEGQRTFPPLNLDDLIAKHLIVSSEDDDDALKFYDSITHSRMFALTKPLRKYLNKDQRVMTKENPIFMF